MEKLEFPIFDEKQQTLIKSLNVLLSKSNGDVDSLFAKQVEVMKSGDEVVSRDAYEMVIFYIATGRFNFEKIKPAVTATKDQDRKRKIELTWLLNVQKIPKNELVEMAKEVKSSDIEVASFCVETMVTNHELDYKSIKATIATLKNEDLTKVIKTSYLSKIETWSKEDVLNFANDHIDEDFDMTSQCLRSMVKRNDFEIRNIRDFFQDTLGKGLSIKMLEVVSEEYPELERKSLS